MTADPRRLSSISVNVSEEQTRSPCNGAGASYGGFYNLLKSGRQWLPVFTMQLSMIGSFHIQAVRIPSQYRRLDCRHWAHGGQRKGPWGSVIRMGGVYRNRCGIVPYRLSVGGVSRETGLLMQKRTISLQLVAEELPVEGVALKSMTFITSSRLVNRAFNTSL